ncbi:MAG: Fic family protein [Candidatus Dojkabacteria bacterium]
MALKPDYRITNKILLNVAEAEAARQIIENSALIPRWERAFQTNALVRTIHHSIAIEGNALSLQDTEKIVSGKNVETTRVRDVQEILNYRRVVDFIATKKEQKFSEAMLADVHTRLGRKILTDSKLGQYRHNEAVIVNSRTGEIVFDPPKVSEVPSEVSDLIQWDNHEGGQLHPLLRAGIIHFELVRIHPFVDLNGRTARIMATWSMYRDSYDIKQFFSLEEYYDQDSKSYYDALDSAHEGDMTAWLEYFIYGVAVELKKVKDQVLELSRDRNLLRRMGQVALNERQIKIIRYLEEHDTFRNKDFLSIFPDISDDTILRDLKDLMDKKLIIKKGRTKASRYLLA